MLEYVPKGFPGAHGSRHLYNMMGGKVYEIDFLFMREIDAASPGASSQADPVILHLPSKDKLGEVSLRVPATEMQVLSQALDCLPWSCLSWSVHRGLRDILLAIAKPIMDKNRRWLADSLHKAVQKFPHHLEAKGWNAAFVRDQMADMAVSAVMAGEGDSGDLVRVVTDVALLLVKDQSIAELDQTHFWRQALEVDAALLSVDLQQKIFALTKCFVLEWSTEFDYQMYHELPLELFFG